MKLIQLLSFVFLYYSDVVVSENIYNYYELALQKWCSDDFMIHGLWPQIDSDNYPTYCEDVGYIQPTNELLKEMKDKWKECNNDLWQHEWEKHGSCIKRQNNLSETDFFNITLKLFDTNKDKIQETCDENNDCILGCFNLQYEPMNCP